MKRVSTLYIAFQVFFGLLLWIPVFYEFQKQIGMSDPEIFGIQSFYYVVFLFLEVPTGYLADRFGFRKCMIAGAGVLVLANLLPIFAANYSGMMTHFILIAGSRALISGAASAYLYDYLALQGKSSLYKDIEGKARSWGLVFKIGSWSAVGFLMELSINLPYWLTSANAAVALAVAVLLPEVHNGLVTKSKNIFDGVLGAAKQLGQSPVLLLLMLQGTGIFVLVRILQVNMFQPILSEKGFAVIHFGWVMAAMTLFEAVGSRKAVVLRAYLSDATAVVFMTLALCLFLALISVLVYEPMVVAGFCLFSLAAGFAFPIQKQLLNDHIPAEANRATLLSVESILNRASCALAVLPIGGLLAEGKLKQILLVSCAVVATAVLLVSYLLRRKEKEASHGVAREVSH